MDRPHLRIVIHQDGVLQTRSLRLPVWLARGLIGTGIVVLALMLLGLALYLPIVAQAARVPGLVREVDRLETENRKITELVAALDSAERRYDRIRSMLGADVVPDPVRLGSSLPVAPTIRATVAGEAGEPEGIAGPTPPTRWPLDDGGFVTRGQSGGAEGGNPGEEPHNGMDIAVPIGSLVRASGGGTVLETGEDSEYGRYVLLDHPDGYQTRYGHLSRSTVAIGTPVDAGEVIGVSGNTGRSSAPHLHFEILRGGQSVDPRTILKEPN